MIMSMATPKRIFVFVGDLDKKEAQSWVVLVLVLGKAVAEAQIQTSVHK